MAHKQVNTDLSTMLFSFMNQPDPMLSMLEWLCEQLMEAEVSAQLSAGKSERSDSRSGYRSGYRPRRLDTRLGTMYLMVPKVRQGGYIPFFVNAYKRSEAALIQVVQEAYINGVSTRKIERLAKQLGIEGISRSQVSEMTRGLNNRLISFEIVLWTSFVTRFSGRMPCTKMSASMAMWSVRQSLSSAASMNTANGIFWRSSRCPMNHWTPTSTYSIE